MFSSRVIVFFDEMYYSGFFDRHGPDLTWTPLASGRSLLREWQLLDSFPLKEIGYVEHIINDETPSDDDYTGEIWFYGDLPSQLDRHSPAE
jgi:hypothetical protein